MAKSIFDIAKATNNVIDIYNANTGESLESIAGNREKDILKYLKKYAKSISIEDCENILIIDSNLPVIDQDDRYDYLLPFKKIDSLTKFYPVNINNEIFLVTEMELVKSNLTIVSDGNLSQKLNAYNLAYDKATTLINTYNDIWETYSDINYMLNEPINFMDTSCFNTILVERKYELETELFDLETKINGISRKNKSRGYNTLPLGVISNVSITLNSYKKACIEHIK